MKYSLLITVVLSQDRGVGSAANRGLIGIDQAVLDFETRDDAEQMVAKLKVSPHRDINRIVERLYT